MFAHDSSKSLQWSYLRAGTGTNTEGASVKQRKWRRSSYVACRDELPDHRLIISPFERAPLGTSCDVSAKRRLSARPEHSIRRFASIHSLVRDRLNTTNSRRWPTLRDIDSKLPSTTSGWMPGLYVSKWDRKPKFHSCTDPDFPYTTEGRDV
jgi:hypothetical protein